MRKRLVLISLTIIFVSATSALIVGQLDSRQDTSGQADYELGVVDNGDLDQSNQPVSLKPSRPALQSVSARSNSVRYDSIDDVRDAPNQYTHEERLAVAFREMNEEYRTPVSALDPKNPYIYSKMPDGSPSPGSEENFQKIISLFDNHTSGSPNSVRQIQVRFDFPTWNAQYAYSKSTHPNEHARQNQERSKIIAALINDLRAQGANLPDTKIVDSGAVAYPHFYVYADKDLVELLIENQAVTAIVVTDAIEIVGAISGARLQVGAELVQLFGVAEGGGHKIAIIDSGVKKSRFDAGTVVAEYCALADPSQCRDNSRSNAEPCGQDACNHGTLVASAAVGKSSKKGIVPDASVVAIRINRQTQVDISAIDLGLSWLLDNHSDVTAVNLSIGSTNTYSSFPCSVSGVSSIRNVLTLLDFGGSAIFSAAGNTGASDAISWPACERSTVSVAATQGSGANEAVWIDSNNSLHATDLLAPGHGINLLNLSGTLTESGTSIASPIAAGVYVGLADFFSFDNNFLVKETLIALIKGLGTPITDTRSGTAPQYPKPRVDFFASSSFQQPSPQCGAEFIGCIGNQPRYIFTFSPPAGMPNIPQEWDVTQQFGHGGSIIEIFEGLTGICLPTAISTTLQNIFTAKMTTEFGTTECTSIVFPVSCGGPANPW